MIYFLLEDTITQAEKDTVTAYCNSVLSTHEPAGFWRRRRRLRANGAILADWRRIPGLPEC